jgi:hypothetical protein
MPRPEALIFADISAGITAFGEQSANIYSMRRNEKKRVQPVKIMKTYERKFNL